MSKLCQRRVVGTGARDQHVVDRRPQLVEELPQPSEVGGVEGRDAAGAHLEPHTLEAILVARGEDHLGSLLAREPRLVSSPMPALPPITTTV